MPIEFRGITPEDLARECYYIKPVGSGYDIIEGQDNNLDDNLRDNARYYFPLSLCDKHCNCRKQYGQGLSDVWS